MRKILFGERNEIKNGILVCIALLLAIPLFAQGDLAHTVASSYGYLENHFFDFYDFNSKTLIGNDYLPTIYVIFAVWSLPLKWLGLTSTQYEIVTSGLSMYELIWGKTLLLVLTICTVLVINRIVNLVRQTSHNKFNVLNNNFLTSPLTIFIVFAMAQYDIVWILLSAVGILLFIKQRNFNAAIVFGFAFSLKYFAVVIFLAFLLIFSKRVTHAVGQFAIFLAPVAMMVLLYWSNEKFVTQIFELPKRLLSQALSTPLFAVALITVATIVYLLGRRKELFKLKPLDISQRASLALTVSLIVFSIAFTILRWNPQWLLVVVFLSSILGDIQTRIKPKLQLAQLIMFPFFIGCLAFAWKGNLDESMLRNGLIGEWGFSPVLQITDFLPPGAFLACLAAVQVWILTPAFIVIIDWKNHRNLLAYSGKSRDYGKVGPLVFIIISIAPVMLCYFVPQNYAETVSSSSRFQSLNASAIGKTHRDSIPVTSDGIVIDYSIPQSQRVFKSLTLDLYGSFADLKDVQFHLLSGSEKLIEIEPIWDRTDNSLLWVKGWRTVYLDLPTSDGIKKLNFSLVISFTGETPPLLWVESNKNSDLAAFRKPILEAIPTGKALFTLGEN